MDQRPTKTPEPPSTPVTITGDDFSWGRTPGAECLWCGDTCTGGERDTHDTNLRQSETRWRELAGGAA